MPHLEQLLSDVIVINDKPSIVSPKAGSFTPSYFYVGDVITIIKAIIREGSSCHCCRALVYKHKTN